MVKIQGLLEKLASYPQQEGVGNPYTEQYALDNLRHYFEYMFNQPGKRILLVGEAPGYKGCRITGIPFTSGRVFQDVPHPMLKALKAKISLPVISGENTATIVWKYLAEQKTTPLFWNAFPFHPHHIGNPESNRPPTDIEVKYGSEVLDDIVRIYKPDLVAGIGHKGIKALRMGSPHSEFTYVRHPSNGGKPDFITGMNNLLDGS